MRDRDRFRLLGTYRTPRVRVGGVLTCEYRDCDVVVVGYSDGRIPWPIGRRRGTSARGLVVYGALAKAVRLESNQAVAYWWGVCEEQVSRWRKALAVGPNTVGTHQLRQRLSGPKWKAACRAGRSRPEVHARIVAAIRARAKLWMPGGRLWTAAEDKIVRALPPAVAARRLKRTLAAVYNRRRFLGVTNIGTGQMRSRRRRAS